MGVAGILTYFFKNRPNGQNSKSIMFIILGNSWLTNFPMRTNNNKSFGLITLPEFFIALKNVLLGKIKTDAEQWIHENKFCRGIPIELLEAVGESGFIRVLCDYNKKAADFLAENEKFYLTIMQN